MRTSKMHGSPGPKQILLLLSLWHWMILSEGCVAVCDRANGRRRSLLFRLPFSCCKAAIRLLSCGKDHKLRTKPYCLLYSDSNLVRPFLWYIREKANAIACHRTPFHLRGHLPSKDTGIGNSHKLIIILT